MRTTETDDDDRPGGGRYGGAGSGGDGDGGAAQHDTTISRHVPFLEVDAGNN